MKIKVLIKILLLITGGLCVASKAIQLPELEFYAKPATMPLFFMLYWFSTKRVDIPFLVVLFLSFLVDIFLLTGIEDSFLYVLICNSVCYSILFYFLFKIFRPIDFSNTDIIYLIIFFVGWTFIVYTFYDEVRYGLGDLLIYGAIYTLVLYFLLIGAVLHYVNVRSTKSLWFLIAILNFFISDSCYALDAFYISSVEFRVMNSLYQFLAIFFLVQFKISSSTVLKLKEF
ncbi:lysoplasmalogenase family protein [Aquimarina pacifica]|uniref:lysoplasmalogenase family protein n=1 Tax=Aquimarina pacifica TaxID=1296415 RepID=UPI000472D09D|nr:lysoplasmalogenase family protein [Aquimarina pacifica]